MKYLSKYIDLPSMKTILTSHYFGTIYYASPVWLNEITTAKQWHLLNVLHYKGIRSICGDFRRKKSRAQLDEIMKRAKPHQWMRYSNAKLVIKLVLLDANGPPLTQEILGNLYHNVRTGETSIMDTSRLRVGKHSMKNRLKCISELQFPWMDGITDDHLRIRLKKTFFDKSN